MKAISLKKTAEAARAVYRGADIPITHITSDSRDIKPGCLFVALKGERFDGHSFVKEAVTTGAACAVVSENVDGVPEEKLLRVEDTRRGFLDIAGFYRRSLGVKVVGVTGSVGKTTTKEMIACVCESRFKTLKTEMNLNNEIGLSQMILRLDESYEAAVLEMGMDGPGQIAPLSLAASPNVAVVTNIGVSHLEAMGTRENIRDEKLSISRGLPDGGILIINGDDDMLAGYNDPRIRIMRYSLSRKNADVYATDIMEFSTHVNFGINYLGNRYDAQIPCLGRHNAQNALAAFCAGVSLGIEPGTAAAALKNYRPAGMRQKIVAHNSYTVVEDCYNAAPDSMRAALETLGRITCGGKRIAVLSDMLELGSIAEEAHLQAGKEAASCGTDILLCCGELAKLYERGAKAAGMKDAIHFESQEELFDYLTGILKPEDVVWFKASRGMKLEQIIQKLYRPEGELN